MPRKATLLAGLLWTALLGCGGATSQPLGGADLVRELSGNTLTGFNGSLWFSEHHVPDGRVFGYNGGVPVQDGCWKVRGDAVCYYYPGGRVDGQDGVAEFCWRFERAGQAGYRIALVDRTGGGVARLEPGNPRNLTDHGRTWTCDAQVSQLRAPHGRRLTGAEGARVPRRAVAQVGGSTFAQQPR